MVETRFLIRKISRLEEQRIAQLAIIDGARSLGVSESGPRVDLMRTDRMLRVMYELLDELQPREDGVTRLESWLARKVP